MSTLASILTAFPNARVTISSGPYRRKPRQGDRRYTKRWGWQIRRDQTYNGMQVTRRGRPVYEWVQESQLCATELDPLRRVGANHGGLSPYVSP